MTEDSRLGDLSGGGIPFIIIEPGHDFMIAGWIRCGIYGAPVPNFLISLFPHFPIHPIQQLLQPRVLLPRPGQGA